MFTPQSLRLIHFLPLLFSLFAISAKGQEVSERIRFTNYLVNNGFFDEAVYESSQLLDNPQLSSLQADSLFYLKGWALYNQKKLALSGQVLKQVSNQSLFYEKSHLFAAYNEMHLGYYQDAQSVLSEFEAENEVSERFTVFLTSGNALLKRETKQYKQIRSQLPDEYYGFSKELKVLDAIADDFENRRPKSPFLAGLMSGVVPGSGKIYAGKTGQGIVALLMTTGLGLVTYENYRKQGPAKFETILFGSAFTLFYVGNIYGSVFSAKIVNDEYHELKNRQILFNLHVPLRNIFD